MKVSCARRSSESQLRLGSSEEQIVSIVNAVEKKIGDFRVKPSLSFKRTQYLGQIRSVFACVDMKQVVNLVLWAAN